MWLKRRLLFWFFFLLSFSSWPQSVSVPAAVLEEIQRDAALIRLESSALGALLTGLGNESADLRKRLREAEAMLSEAETLLAEASLSLVKSESELIPLREDLGRLKTELAALLRQAAALNGRLRKLEKEKKFWRIAAISAGVIFVAVEVGRVVGK